MGLGHSPRIVTDGLVLALDAGNAKSSYKNFIKAKVYSVYSGGLRSANYSVQYSDDNSNWTTAFSGVCSNNTSCGIQENTGLGNGSYGYRRYWRYVEGSAVVSHHPRVSRIILTDVNGVDYNLIVYASDNCSDTGTYIVGTVSVDFATNIWTDLSGNSNTGTLTNGPTYSSANGGSVSFDGTNDYVDVPNALSSISSSNSHTFSFWFNADNLSTDKIPFSSGLAGNYYIQLTSSVFYVQIGSSYRTYSFSTSTNTWYNVCFVKNGINDAGDLYINSSLKSSYTGSIASTPSGLSSLFLGKYYSGYEFPGKIAQVQIYNKALTAAEVQQNFNALKSRFGLT
jgi:hypothetical protein